MNMKKNKGVAVLILTVLITGLLAYVSAAGVGSSKTGAAKNIKLGLDLAGGVSITYETVKDNPSAKDMADTIYKLQKRVENYSSESTVYQEGDNRINIEIPGVSDANKVLEELGKPGSLEFQLEDGTVVVDGKDVKDAQPANRQDNTTGKKEAVVQLTFNKAGTKKFADATSENIGKIINIVYDGKAVSSPKVNQAITGGEAEISGMANFEEAENLASTIRIGGLNLELKELRSNVVGAQLGEEAIQSSLKAGAIGFAIVLIFMCVVYLLPGVASSIALAIYVGLMLLCLNAFNITLTLPGIAGIILSIGMAVDANVIIFARVKEELGAGKTVRSALKVGFKKALSAIVDGNITTLIAALVLGLKGSGSVKGFAQTLALGIVLSMFTALVVTRLIINALYAVGLKNAKLYGIQKERKVINFLSKKHICFVISIVLILAGFVGMGVHSSKGDNILKYSLEFVGGTSTNVTFNEDYSIKDIDSKIVPEIEKITGDGNIQTQKVAGTKQVVIKTRELKLKEREEFNKVMESKFKVNEKKITVENISSTISNEMRTDAVVAVIIATICMLIYIWFRFKDVRFAASAVLALLHDVLVVLAFYAIARISVGSTFIACMLTIVGYSINATIVIFDRIREGLKTRKKNQDLKDLVNESITQTLTRTIYTSLTTFVMVFVLFIMGVTSVREFALPLMVGIICGAYSSVCITGALWYVLKTKFGKKK